MSANSSKVYEQKAKELMDLISILKLQLIGKYGPKVAKHWQKRK